MEFNIRIFNKELLIVGYKKIPIENYSNLKILALNMIH